MSKNFEKVKKYYDKGLWDKQKVYRAVGKWITEEEYEEITGESFTVSENNEESEEVAE